MGKKDNPRNFRLDDFISIPGKMLEQLILESFAWHNKDKKMIWFK